MSETTRPTPPSLKALAAAWADVPIEELLATFPRNRSPALGWGRPFCFRCGIVPPVITWLGASGWLERAHLQDHDHGGSSEPQNLVPLCVLCHVEQDICETRDEGIAFVNSPCIRRTLVPFAQYHLEIRYSNQTSPGRSNATRWMLRAFSTVGALFAIEAEKEILRLRGGGA